MNLHSDTLIKEERMKFNDVLQWEKDCQEKVISLWKTPPSAGYNSVSDQVELIQ